MSKVEIPFPGKKNLKTHFLLLSCFNSHKMCRLRYFWYKPHRKSTKDVLLSCNCWQLNLINWIKSNTTTQHLMISKKNKTKQNIFFLVLAQDARIDAGLRHSVVRRAQGCHLQKKKKSKRSEREYVWIIHYQSHWQPSWKTVCFWTSLRTGFKKTKQTTWAVLNAWLHVGMQ